jgi:hypothetical protein
MYQIGAITGDRSSQAAVFVRYDTNVPADETQYQRDEQRPQLAVVR